MNIDIISYTDEQYASLTMEQLKEIREAQIKKDNLTVNLQEEIQKNKDALVKKGIFNSKIFQLRKTELETEYTRQVDLLRDGLQFYLKYSMHPDGEGLDAPYSVNFALSYEERFKEVRDYYMTAYQDPKEGFEAFQADQFALQYLGELYATLYDYLWLMAEQATS